MLWINKLQKYFNRWRRTGHVFRQSIPVVTKESVWGKRRNDNQESAYAWYSALAGAATNDALAGRIKYLGGSARTWWLRSPYVGRAYYPRIVYTSGNVYGNSAYYAIGLAPACCII